MTKKYNVYSDFDIELHQKTFIHYLEIIIHPDGSVHYAIPSHQEYEIKRLSLIRGWTRQELDDVCPQEYYYDFMRWLLMQTGDMSVWEEIALAVNPTNAQIKTLQALKDAGLFLGEVQNHEHRNIG